MVIHKPLFIKKNLLSYAQAVWEWNVLNATLFVDVPMTTNIVYVNKRENCSIIRLYIHPSVQKPIHKPVHLSILSFIYSFILSKCFSFGQSFDQWKVRMRVNHRPQSKHTLTPRSTLMYPFLPTWLFLWCERKL